MNVGSGLKTSSYIQERVTKPVSSEAAGGANEEQES